MKVFSQLLFLCVFVSNMSLGASAADGSTPGRRSGWGKVRASMHLGKFRDPRAIKHATTCLVDALHNLVQRNHEHEVRKAKRRQNRRQGACVGKAFERAQKEKAQSPTRRKRRDSVQVLHGRKSVTGALEKHTKSNKRKQSAGAAAESAENKAAREAAEAQCHGMEDGLKEYGQGKSLAVMGVVQKMLRVVGNLKQSLGGSSVGDAYEAAMAQQQYVKELEVLEGHSAPDPEARGSEAEVLPADVLGKHVSEGSMFLSGSQLTDLMTYDGSQVYAPSIHAVVQSLTLSDAFGGRVILSLLASVALSLEELTFVNLGEPVTALFSNDLVFPALRVLRFEGSAHFKHPGYVGFKFPGLEAVYISGKSHHEFAWIIQNGWENIVRPSSGEDWSDSRHEVFGSADRLRSKAVAKAKSSRGAAAELYNAVMNLSNSFLDLILVDVH